MFEYNQKVVPVNKSIGVNLEKSNVWRNAKEREQPFLYFKGKDYTNRIVCHYNVDVNKEGDYFLLEDLIPYEEPVVIAEAISFRSLSAMVVSKLSKNNLGAE